MTALRAAVSVSILAVCAACAATEAPPARPQPYADLLIPGDPYLSRVATRWFEDGDDTRLVKVEAAAADAVERCGERGWRRDHTADACAELRKLDRTVKAIRAAESAEAFARRTND